MGTTTETRISSTQAKDAIYKAHSISSSASEIDGSIMLIGNAANYGVIADGTDKTVNLQNCINAISQVGGKISLPKGTIRIDGQIFMPDNLATTNPTQPSIIIEGQGCLFDGRGGEPNGGTILDMRYSGALGKLVTLGLGRLEITGITFRETGLASTPFIYTTYTTLHIHGNGFYGNKIGVLCDQDAIVLGGLTQVEGPRGDNVGFQGYGTIIEGNYFNKIRRAVYGRCFFNANIIMNNTIWNKCGSNLINGAAIEIDGDPDNIGAQTAAGNVISQNLIEMVNYPYGIKIVDGQKNSCLANNFYDPTYHSLGYYYMGTDAKYNYILAGYHNDSYTFVDGNINENTSINPHQGTKSIHQEAQLFRAEIQHKPLNETAVPKSIELINNLNDSIYYRHESNRFTFYHTPVGSSTVPLFTMRNYTGGIIEARVRGTDCRLVADGSLRVRSAPGTDLTIGDASNAILTINNTSATFVRELISNENINIKKGIKDKNSSTGVAGQVLIANGDGTCEWKTI